MMLYTKDVFYAGLLKRFVSCWKSPVQEFIFGRYYREPSKRTGILVQVGKNNTITSVKTSMKNSTFIFRGVMATSRETNPNTSGSSTHSIPVLTKCHDNSQCKTANTKDNHPLFHR
jgi:hypothetical protein